MPMNLVNKLCPPHLYTLWLYSLWWNPFSALSFSGWNCLFFQTLHILLFFLSALFRDSSLDIFQFNLFSNAAITAICDISLVGEKLHNFPSAAWCLSLFCHDLWVRPIHCNNSTTKPQLHNKDNKIRPYPKRWSFMWTYMKLDMGKHIQEWLRFLFTRSWKRT